jgi:hypothetical protein
MKVIVTAVGLLMYGQLDDEINKLDVFHVKFDDIQAIELNAHKAGGELILWIADQDTTINYTIFDDSTYHNVQEALIRTWENR